jgi:hypothetical protein
MPMLHQHPEGLVFVRTEHGHYGETRKNFEADHGAVLPPLPEGITERIYEPGKRHALVRGTDVVDGGPMPWPEGDAIIAKGKDLLARQQDRADAVIAAARKKLEDEAKAKLEEAKAAQEAAKAKAIAAFEQMNREREAQGKAALPPLTFAPDSP